MTSIYTYRQGVSTPYGGAVPLIQASRRLTGMTSHHRYSRCLDLSRETSTHSRHSSTERVTQLRHSSTERVTQLRYSSTERVPLLKHSFTEKVPLLKRSSTETFQLTRMSPFRRFFTEMYYYNRCSDFLRKSLPHATINWCQ